MKRPLTGAQLEREIEHACRKDLCELVKRTKLPRERWVSMAVLTVDRTTDDLWDGHVKWLRAALKARKQFAKEVDNLYATARGRKFKEELERLEPLVNSQQTKIDGIRQILNKNRRSDQNHTLAILMESILRLKNDFNSWQALSRVMRVAAIASGQDNGDEKAKTLSRWQQRLRRAAKAAREGEKARTEASSKR